MCVTDYIMLIMKSHLNGEFIITSSDSHKLSVINLVLFLGGLPLTREYCTVVTVVSPIKY